MLHNALHSLLICAYLPILTTQTQDFKLRPGATSSPILGPHILGSRLGPKVLRNGNIVHNNMLFEVQRENRGLFVDRPFHPRVTAAIGIGHARIDSPEGYDLLKLLLSVSERIVPLTSRGASRLLRGIAEFGASVKAGGYKMNVALVSTQLGWCDSAKGERD
jgi:hypothetical protein